MEQSTGVGNDQRKELAEKVESDFTSSVKQSWGLFLDPNMHAKRKVLAEKVKMTATLKN